MGQDWEIKLRAELERAGERAVRDDFIVNGGIFTTGDPRREFTAAWLREKEIWREQRNHALIFLAQKSLRYARWTYYTAVAGLIIVSLGLLVIFLRH